MQRPDLNVFKNQLCIGCGACENLCPKSVLKIKEKNGFYKIDLEQDACVKCNICTANCLFSKEDFLKYEVPSKAYIGYDLDEASRLNSASGGMLTCTLKYMLSHKYIDGVVTAKFEKGQFFYTILTELEALDKARGSVYMPLHFNDIWKKIKDFKGKLAFVGTPCYCEEAYKLRDSQRSFANIKYIFALVCGHMPSKNATINFLDKKGINSDLSKVEDMKYRGEGWPGGGYLKYADNKEAKFKHTDIWSYEDMSSSYTYNEACSTCSDLWGSYSDLGFADYWNPEHMKEGKGYSLVMVHNEAMAEILQNMQKEKSAYLEEITVEQGIKTQAVPLYVKTILNPKRRSHLLGRKIKLGDKLYIKLEDQLKKQKYNSVQYNLLNKITWRTIVRGAGKHEKANGNKPL
jgi:coenzyme F420-reducing hydrogenase beta subunit